MYKHLLVPLDGSGLATEIVSQAVSFATALGARITFFNARADFSATEQGALLRSVDPGVFSENLAGESNGILMKAEVEARAKGVSCSSVIYNSDRPAVAILAAVEKVGCDLIFMGSHGYKGLSSLFMKSETQKVIAGATIPVLVATIESNQKDHAKLATIAIIQDEHRSLAAVLHGLLHLVDEALAGSSTLDVPLVRSMVYYIESFSERLHHPKEDAYLFEVLSFHTKKFDQVICDLQEQHRNNGVLLRDLERAIDRFVRDNESLNAVAVAAHVFAETQWLHMSLEENVILPAAFQHLRDEDWSAIHDAFSKNKDPQFDVDLDGGFRRLYSRIINLIPPQYL